MTSARLDRLRHQMSENKLDAILILNPSNRIYLSGFTGSSATLLITADQALLFTDFRYVDQAAAQSPHFTVVRVTGSPLQAIADRCQESHVGRIGFEGDYLTVDARSQCDELLRQQELISVTGLVERLRRVKDESEIKLMRQAAAITDLVWQEIQPQISVGVAERDLAVEMDYRMKKHGAEGVAFDMIVASGVRSAMPHGRASEKLLAQGDLITFDFGAKYQGYCSDMTRTVMLGEPTAKQREIYAIVLEAQMRGLAACKAGVTGLAVDEVCREYIREQGYGEAFGHGTGHGVGRDIHEDPRLSIRGAKDLLVPGMIVTIEPGIYLSGWGGVRIEDMVLVTDQGCERLSQSPKALIIL